MELKPIRSSNLEAIGHDPDSQELQVQFKGGGVYAYDGVPKELFEELLNAKSVGSLFHAKIKDKFKFRRLL